MTAPTTIHIEAGWGLELILRPPPAEIQTIVTVRYDGFEATAKGDHMAYTLPVDHLVVVQVSYVDAAGNPAKVDGDVRWETSDPAIATVQVDSGDSTMATVVGVKTLGTAQITATADADLGAGVRELITLLDVTTVAGEAVAGTISPMGESQPVAPHVEPRK